MNTAIAQNNMIEQQIRPWDVLDDRVLDVMAEIPREAFVPEQYQHLAYADLEIPIGFNEKMMHPRVEGRLMQMLSIQPTDKIYEVGTGSGYLTACLARLGAHVDSIEIHPELSSDAAGKLEASDYTNITLKTGNALTEFSGDDNKHDVIVLTGSLPNYDDLFMEQRFIERLKEGGRLFVVTGRPPAMQALLITQKKTGATTEVLFETSLKPLTGAEQKPVFKF